MNKCALKLCLVTHQKDQPFDLYRNFIMQVVKGGVTSVQLRVKNVGDIAVLEMGRSLKTLLDSYHIPLIINDCVQVAKALGAHLHIGPHDMSPFEARKILGKDAIIGLSIESLEELHWANQLDCINYVAASAIFPSKTKTDCKMHWHLNGLKEFVALSHHPVIGIGGIELDNVESVIEQGATGVAVIGAIHSATDPAIVASQFIHKINQSLGKNHHA